MAVITRDQIKEKFKQGNKPTEQDFEDLLDSYFHSQDNLDLLIPRASIAEAQAGLDNIKVMTPFTAQSLVALRIAELINSAPGALDTLQEISAALNNDPDFYNSINNLITARMEKGQNLSDVQDTDAARQNLSVYSKAEQDDLSSDFMNMFLEISDPNELVIIHGANITVNSQDFSITSGAAFYNGERFKIEATVFTAPPGEIGIFQINGAPNPTGIVRTIEFVSGISASGIKDHDGVIRMKNLFQLSTEGVFSAKVINSGNWNTFEVISGGSNALFSGASINSHYMVFVDNDGFDLIAACTYEETGGGRVRYISTNWAGMTLQWTGNTLSVHNSNGSSRFALASWVRFR